MIIFFTVYGKKVKIDRACDEDSFEEAMCSDDPGACFRVGARIYFNRSVATFQVSRRRGPYPMRVRSRLEDAR